MWRRTGIFVLGSWLVASAESEPNNEAAKAESVEIGKDVEFRFTPRGDRDYFKLTSPGDGVIGFRLKKGSPEHSPHPWWGEHEGEDGKRYILRDGKWDRRVRKGEDVVFAIRGNYYGHNEKESDDVLVGVFEFSAPVDREPNDADDQAIGVDIDEQVSFTFQPRHDVDRFAIAAPGDGVIRFVLDGKVEDHSPYPWWGEFTGEDGRDYERRSGMWDIAATRGEKLVFAIRSNYYSHSEKSSSEVLRGRFVFEPRVGAEPNDSMETAAPVEVGEEFSFQLNPRKDRDYFKMESPGSGTLRFRLTQTSEAHDPEPWWGEYAGEDGKSYLRRPGQWDRDVVAGEEVILAVRSNHYDHKENGSPDVLKGIVEFTERFDDEPNDSADEATPIEPGKPFRFQLTPRLDRDYFTFTSPGRGTVKFTITERPDEAAGLYPWWGEVERDGRLFEFRSGQWDRAVEQGDTVVLAVRSSYFGHKEVAIDELIAGVVEFTAEDGDEPNDLPEQARTVGIGEPFGIVLNPRGDRDCFRATGLGDGVLRFTRTDDSDVHPGLFPVWIQDGTAYPGYRETRVAGGGEAVVQVRSNRFEHNARASTEAATAVIEFVAEPDAPETGEEPADASAIAIGRPFRFAILPSWDRDHFRFTPKEDGHVRLRLVTAPPAGKHLGYWWHEGADGDPVETEVLQVQSGKTYILGLSADGQSWSSEDVLEAVVESTDAPADPVRRWTFEIERLAE